MRASTLLLAAGASGLLAACGPGREATVQGRAKAAAARERAMDAPADAATMAMPAAAAPEGMVLAHFRCETGELLTIRFDNAANTATILSPTGDRVLAGQPAGSGISYASPLASIRGKGDDLEYAVGRRAPAQCVAINDRLQRILAERRAAGVQWRAIGQEPGWTVEVMADGGLEAQLDYGRERRSTPPAARSGEGARQAWAASTESGTLRLTIERAACQDMMSGERFWFTATLEADGRTLKGCAQPLG
mgnify:CR=1 FL=1